MTNKIALIEAPLAAPQGARRSLLIAGHFGFAAMVKSREPTAPLWGLMLATVWFDVIFVPLFMLHVEKVQPVHQGYGGSNIHADYTHSIVGMILISAVLGLAFLPKWGRRVATVIGWGRCHTASR